jgi:hypothetical protein
MQFKAKILNNGNKNAFLQPHEKSGMKQGDEIITQCGIK